MTLHFQNKDIKSLRISELKLVNNSGTIYYLFKKKKRNGKKIFLKIIQRITLQQATC